MKGLCEDGFEFIGNFEIFIDFNQWCEMFHRKKIMKILQRKSVAIIFYNLIIKIREMLFGN